MKKHLLSLSLALLGVALLARGETEITHIRVGSDHENGTLLPLNDYNRISFTDNSVIFFSTVNGDVTEQTFDLSQFHIIEFVGDNSGIEGMIADNSGFCYDSASQSLVVDESNPESFTVYVCDLSGSVLIKGNPAPDCRFYIGNITPGVYVAVALSNQSRKVIKFIK